jgi:hypothetical protein
VRPTAATVASVEMGSSVSTLVSAALHAETWLAGPWAGPTDETLCGSDRRGTGTSAEEVRGLDQIVGNEVNGRSVDR